MRPRPVALTLIVVLGLLLGAGTAAAGSATADLATAGSATAYLAAPSAPVSTTFTYQGQLQNNGAAVSGSCDLAFRLYDDASAGVQINNPITTTNVAVAGGQFTVPLDFGAGAFSGAARWLDIRVKCGADPSFTALTPRQPLTAAPYALFALSTGALQGQPVSPNAPASGQVLKWTGSAWAPGADNIGGAGAFWSLTGNAGTNPAANFLGTTDNTALTLAVSGTAALRLVPNDLGPNLIGGYSANTITGTLAYGAVIAGGGAPGVPNTVQGGYVGYAFIGGGAGNQINSPSAQLTVIGGGSGNVISGSVVAESSILGGIANKISGSVGTIGGGGFNVVTGTAGVVAGGEQNAARATYAAIGGGYANQARSYGDAIGGGSSNAISTGDSLSGDNVIGGGLNNQITSTTHSFAVIAGGVGNIITGTNGSDNVIGGGYFNLTNAGAATIGGGFQNAVQGAAGVVGGGEGNILTGTHATVAGGLDNSAAGNYAALAGGWQNSASGERSAVAGGYLNTASEWYASVSGGYSNTASSFGAHIGGGYLNTASGLGSTVGGGGYDGIYSIGNQSLGNATTIGGGVGNVISPTTYESTIGGGIGNVISSNTSVIGGGYFNLAANGSATVGGGSLNRATGQGATVGGGGWNGSANSGNTASGTVATIAGGYGNTASGAYATVPGGQSNTAGGAGSLAAGTGAQAAHNGAFVWADDTGSTFTSTGQNQFLVRAAGGVGINTNTPAASLDVSGTLRVTGPLTSSTALNIVQGSVKVTGAAIYSTTVTATAFIWQASAANSGGTNGDSTFIDDPLINGRTDILLFITHNYTAGGAQVDNHPIGVYYNGGNNKWGIYNEDLTAMSVGQAFNVLVILP